MQGGFVGYGLYMPGGGTAASTNDVQPAFIQQGAEQRCHDAGRLAVGSECVGEAGVGVCGHCCGHIGDGSDEGNPLCQCGGGAGYHLLGSEAAVESYGERMDM